jgi:hypothetical protein
MKTISPVFGMTMFSPRPAAQHAYAKEDYLSMFSREGQNTIHANWDAYREIMATPGELRQAVRQYQQLRGQITDIEDFVVAINRLEGLDDRFRPNGQFFLCMLMDWLIHRQEPPTGGQLIDQQVHARPTAWSSMLPARRLLSY